MTGSWNVAEAGSGLFAPDPGPKHLSGELLQRWLLALDDWEAGEGPRRALRDLSRAETLVVVTGQQPGVWGGPLYCLYKAATAVALARRIRTAGRPAVAVFWAQGDDTDWDEAGWGSLPRPDLSLYRMRWRPSPLEPREWVGRAVLEFPPEARAVLEAWPELPEAAWGAPSPHRPVSLSRGFVRLLLHHFGDEGLLPLDGRWPELRMAAGDLWRAYAPRHTALAAAVRERGHERERAGLAAPLDAEASDHGLFVLDGPRRLHLSPEEWNRQVDERLRADRHAELAPSVLLRAPLQDYLFGTAAQVVGSSEAAYLDQLTPLYERLELHTPLRPPRLRATLTPQGLLPDGEAETVLADPEAWIAARAEGLVPQPARAHLRELREALDVHLRGLVDAGETFAKDLGQATAAARRKIDGQVHRLEDTLNRRARQTLYRSHPEFRHLAEFLRPRRVAQERGLSAVTASLYLGDEAGSRLLAAAENHLDQVERGELHHFVLEVPGD